MDSGLRALRAVLVLLVFSGCQSERLPGSPDGGAAEQCQPNTNPCGDDGCGGSHGACCIARCTPGVCGRDGCGGSCPCCQPNTNPCGDDGCGGNHGPCCTPRCAPGRCGDDGCGGSCEACAAGTTCSLGSCVSVGGCVSPWSPTWQQTASAGPWWLEFEVTGGGSLPRRVSLEVVSTGADTPLLFSFGRWAGGALNLAEGTPVILHATDVTGATAQTVPFHYLVEPTPLTDPCGGTASTTPGCAPLSRGLVSITMDDSFASQWELALPAMRRFGVKATIYHVTDDLESYGGLAGALLLAAEGHEIASHTRTHPALTTLSAKPLDDELRLSKEYLLAHVGTPVESFASPMGRYNATVQAAIRPYYQSHRTANVGVNSVGSDVYELSVDGVYNTVTPTEVCGLLADAAAKKEWRILVFHDFTPGPAPALLSYRVSDFENILACARATPGLDVVTVRQGVAAIACGSP